MVPALKTIYLYFTNNCNLNCLHCWIDPVFNSEKIDADIKPIMDAIIEAKKLGLKTIKITGGEPFLHKKILQLIEDVSKEEIDIIIETNATLIGENEAAVIRENRVKKVAVSLDSFHPFAHDYLRGVEGAFDKALKAIKILKKHEIPLEIIMCLYKKNKEDIKKMIGFSESLGAKTLKINPIEKIGRGDRIGRELLSTKEILDVYESVSNSISASSIDVFFDIPLAFIRKIDKIKVQRRCNIVNILGILVDGSFSICGIGENIPELNISPKNRSVKQIWEYNKIFKFIRENIPDKLEGVCSRCIFKYICLGKCRAIAYYRYGSLTAPFPFCQDAYEKGIFPETRLY